MATLLARMNAGTKATLPAKLQLLTMTTLEKTTETALPPSKLHAH